MSTPIGARGTTLGDMSLSERMHTMQKALKKSWSQMARDGGIARQTPLNWANGDEPDLATLRKAARNWEKTYKGRWSAHWIETGEEAPAGGDEAAIEASARLYEKLSEMGASLPPARFKEAVLLCRDLTRRGALDDATIERILALMMGR